MTPAEINAGAALKLIEAPMARSNVIRNSQAKTAIATKKVRTVRATSAGFIHRL